MNSALVNITILVDNRAGEKLIGEHGLSVWIEVDGRPILFDTGGPFYLDPGGKRADAMDDDLALWIRTGRGLVVCVGCCHAGVVNTFSSIFVPSIKNYRR